MNNKTPYYEHKQLVIEETPQDTPEYWRAYQQQFLLARSLPYNMQFVMACAEANKTNYDNLEQELKNLLKLLRLAYQAQQTEAICCFVQHLCKPAGVLEVRGYFSEQEYWLERGIEIAHHTERQGDFVEFIIHRAICTNRNNLELAYQRWLEVEAFMEFWRGVIPDENINAGLILVYINVGYIVFRGFKNLTEAKKLYQQALELSETIVGSSAYNVSKLVSLAALSEIYLEEGNYAQAKVVLQESLALSLKEADPHIIMGCELVYAQLAQAEGDDRQAEMLYRRGWDFYKELNAPVRKIELANRLGELTWQRGNYLEAKTWFEKAYQLAQASDDKRSLIITFKSLGTLSYLTSDYAQGQQYLQKSLYLAQELGDPILLEQSKFIYYNIAYSLPIWSGIINFSSGFEVGSSINTLSGILLGLTGVALSWFGRQNVYIFMASFAFFGATAAYNISVLLQLSFGLKILIAIPSGIFFAYISTRLTLWSGRFLGKIVRVWFVRSLLMRVRRILLGFK